ncbi:MAG: AIR synthase family protein [Gemmatimonadetes bacterium]|nr:AIR synthase family protein [Gemmatimonadota bacterium]
MCAFLPPGKLPLDMLSGLLRECTAEDERILVGPQVGEDAAVIDFGGTCLVVKTDPITFATDEIGHYAVHVNANDIATMGAVPRWFLATLLLPEGRTSETLVRTIFDSLQRAAGKIGVSLCGGHTEITAGLDRPIVVGQMLGEVSRERLVRSSGLQAGDCILLTRGLGIEATAILAREKEADLRDRGFDAALLKTAREYLHTPGISILEEARIACETAPVHAMHDPTEGGVATALRELAAASGCGLSVEADALFASEETRLLCDAFQLDPLGVISSGALLIGVTMENADRVRDAIRAAGIPCEIVARVELLEFGLKLRINDTVRDLPEFDRDEIGKIF